MRMLSLLLLGALLAAEVVTLPLLIRPAGSDSISFSVRGGQVAEAEVRGDRNTEYGSSRIGFSARVPLVHDPEGGEWFVAVASDHRQLDGALRFDDFDQELADNVHSTSVSVGNVWHWGPSWRVAAAVGIASRKDVDVTDDPALTAEVAGVHQLDRSRSIIAGIIYDSDRLYPLPLLAWMYAPGRHFQLTIGLPLIRVNWQPDEMWKLQATVGPFYNARIERRIAPDAALFIYTDSDDWWYRPDDRRDEDTRIRYEDQRVGLGLRLQPPQDRRGSLELRAGWSLDRRLYATDEVTWFDDGREEGRELDPAFFVALSGSARF